MNLLKLNLGPNPLHHHRRGQLKLRPPYQPQLFTSREQNCRLSQSFSTPLYSFTKYAKASKVFAFSIGKIEEGESEDCEEYLAEDGEVYQKTLRLVECAMFAAVSGLAFLLSNSLAIEKYFACFFALPIVLSTMRWGIAAGRKTMVATAVLLFVLSGPVKAITYLMSVPPGKQYKSTSGLPDRAKKVFHVFVLILALWTHLLHGMLGFAMGASWRSKTSWGASLFLCTIVRATGALCNVVIASYLIGENILALITINVHALVTYILSCVGIIAVPSMNFIYFIFGFLLMLNCGSKLSLPKWLEGAI
ncbi:hypothetical protein CASFOL_024276 [Castilleja foliolosa]|uniref:Uncharacterized protein n=1 Tax=Castilleja foliolosa TaxID=1961234 RepID=A0ABD3CRS6_9LAMI